MTCFPTPGNFPDGRDTIQNKTETTSPHEVYCLLQREVRLWRDESENKQSSNE